MTLSVIIIVEECGIRRGCWGVGVLGWERRQRREELGVGASDNDAGTADVVAVFVAVDGGDHGAPRGYCCCKTSFQLRLKGLRGLQSWYKRVARERNDEDKTLQMDAFAKHLSHMKLEAEPRHVGIVQGRVSSVVAK